MTPDIPEPTNPDDVSAPITAEELEAPRAAIEEDERLQRLERVCDEVDGWSVDVLLVRSEESAPWIAKSATTWGAREVDQKTPGDRLHAAIVEAERRANAGRPPTAEQGNSSRETR
jgi:hypothetical protein